MIPSIQTVDHIDEGIRLLEAKSKIIRWLQQKHDKTHKGISIAQMYPKRAQRIQNQLKFKLEEGFALVLQIAELKFLNGEIEKDVSNWCSLEEKELEILESSLEKKSSCIRETDFVQTEENDETCMTDDENARNDLILGMEESKVEEVSKENAASEARKIFLELESERFEQKRKSEIELETKHKQEAEKKPQKDKHNFKGTFLDWTKIGEKLEIAEHKLHHQAPVTRLSFLREYVSEKPDSEIANLPFNEVGYEKAVEILTNTPEIVNTHRKKILKLPALRKDFDLTSVHDFYRRFNVIVGSLKTLGKLDAAEILTKEVLKKLDPMKKELTRSSTDWRDWNLEKLLESLRQYVIRHPDVSTDSDVSFESSRSPSEDYPESGISESKDSEKSESVDSSESLRSNYPELVGSSECDKSASFDGAEQPAKRNRSKGEEKSRKDRSKIKNGRSQQKTETKVGCKLCSSLKNCIHQSGNNSTLSKLIGERILTPDDSSERTDTQGTGSDTSNETDSKFSDPDSRSLDPDSRSLDPDSRSLDPDSRSLDPDSKFLVQHIEETIHPTLMGIVDGQKFRMLLDTGAGSSFISSTLANHLNIPPLYWEEKSMETMTSVVKQTLPVYNIVIRSLDDKHTLDLKVNKLDRPVLTSLPNPDIKKLKKRYPYLRGLKFHHEDNEKRHPIHVILGAGEITRIKAAGFVAGEVGQPVAENTLYGWYLMGSGENKSLS